jgi:F0F1-type ATP synthase assembly protein I
MEDPDRLNHLERRIERLTSVAACAAGLGAAYIVLQLTTKDWGWSQTAGGISATVAFFVAFVLLVRDVEKAKK